MGRGDGFGLRGAALTQKNGEDDDRKDGQELTLPILEGLEPKLARAQEVPKTLDRQCVGHPRFVLQSQSTEGVECKRYSARSSLYAANPQAT
jgi:hypothetical protein